MTKLVVKIFTLLLSSYHLRKFPAIKHLLHHNEFGPAPFRHSWLKAIDTNFTLKMFMPSVARTLSGNFQLYSNFRPLRADKYRLYINLPQFDCDTQLENKLDWTTVEGDSSSTLIKMSSWDGKRQTNNAWNWRTNWLNVSCQSSHLLQPSSSSRRKRQLIQCAWMCKTRRLFAETVY